MWKLCSKASVEFKVCKNCKGNGYITLNTKKFCSSVITCKNCTGEGHFKPKNWINEYKNETQFTNF